MSRPFSKPALSIEKQLALLASRGLEIPDVAVATHYLEQIGFYRLSGYMLPFQIGGGGADKHNFKPGIDFERIVDCYTFDRKLRLLVLDAVERIEISIRSALSNSVATRNGPHWYLNSRVFAPGLMHSSYVEGIKSQIGHDGSQNYRRDTFIRHYYANYDSPDMPPCWMVFEAVSFTTVSITVKFLVNAEAKPLCAAYGLNQEIMSSWLHSISYIRNLCAHHARLWNRVCTIKPKIAHAFKDELISNDRMYAQLAIMQILLRRIAPTSLWAARLISLLDEHPNIRPSALGFPIDWKQRAIWRP